MISSIGSITTMASLITGSVIGMSIVTQFACSTFNRTYRAVENIATSNYPCFDELYEYIENNSIELRIQIINNVLKENTGNKKSIEMSIDSVTTSLNKINEILNEIKMKKEYQDSIYLSNWSIRKYNCTEILERLKTQINILNVRFDDMIKIINL